MREEFILKFDDKVSLVGYKWTKPDMVVRGVIQIVHGMAEHILRYSGFGEEMASKGFIVLGVDLYAHGKSAESPDKVGEVLDYDFMDAMIKSVKLVRENHEELFAKNQIHCLFGHSMGSMISQYYIEKYPDDFNHLILSGPEIGRGLYRFAKVITGLFNKKGKIVYSDFVQKISIDGFNKKFVNDHPTIGWLSRNENNRRSYEKDPLCGKKYPVNYFYSLSCMLLETIKKKNLNKINKQLKVFSFSGIEDPVAQFGKNIYLLDKRFKKLNIKHKYKIYDNARHEVLHESDEIIKLVYADILKFLK